MAKRSKKRTEVQLVDPLTRYLQQVNAYPMLSAEEERSLALRMHQKKDVEAARTLVNSHLRLVVKIAMEYRRAYYNLLDLIQEGSIGLMHAVKKFDPDKGARLGTYATWWIRSYILKFILDNFRLVKIGTTKEQKKLFFNLMREKEKIESLGFHADSRLLAEKLHVTQAGVEEMTQRLTSPEYALEAPSGPSGEAILKDFIPIDETPADEQLEQKEGEDILQAKLSEFSKVLEDRELKIFEQRLVSELPITLQEIADEYGITKERVRQIEEKILEKLRKFFKESGIEADILRR